MDGSSKVSLLVEGVRNPEVYDGCRNTGEASANRQSALPSIMRDGDESQQVAMDPLEEIVVRYHTLVCDGVFLSGYELQVSTLASVTDSSAARKRRKLTSIDNVGAAIFTFGTGLVPSTSNIPREAR